MTGHEFLEKLSELPLEILDKQVVLSMRRNEQDYWPRLTFYPEIDPVYKGETVTFLGIVGMSDDRGG